MDKLLIFYLNRNFSNHVKPAQAHSQAPSYCFFGLCLYGKAQDDPYVKIADKIDSLAGLGLPKSALAEIDNLDALARKNKNNPQQVRAVIYRMTFMSYLEENALTAIIDRLRTDIDKAKYPVKPVLQSLLAEMFWKYYQQNRYQFSQRTALAKLYTDFTRWDLKTIINETSRLYQLSLKDDVKELQHHLGIQGGQKYSKDFPYAQACIL